MTTRPGQSLGEAVKHVRHDSCIDDGPAAPRRLRGEMLWFNEARQAGLILTEDGDRLPVAGRAFAKGMTPKGRCARTAVSYEVTERDGVREAAAAVLVTEPSPRRARRRQRSPGR